jgi:hypothetical protein
MFRTLFLIAFALAVAIGGGAASAWVMIDRDVNFGGVAIGPWRAFPDLGTPAADPYSSARFALTGDLSLGQAEGIVFTAARDSSGAPLNPRCDYLVEGPVPPARHWTMHVRETSANGAGAAYGRHGALHSLAILRNQDGSFSIALSPRPAPGNWLRIHGSRDINLVLTLYDTAVATTARAAVASSRNGDRENHWAASRWCPSS